ncbi:MAG: hypothetical protein HYX92_08260 [Chloroflexi bacterium]|nr:hypothetical protein [Chloroflexota bacterium]
MAGIYYLSDEDVRWIRGELAKHRQEGSYMARKWSVSHYNRDAEALAPFRFPPSVVIRDITLRTINHAHGPGMTRAEKVRVAVELEDAGITQMELAMTWHPDIEAFIKDLRQAGVRAELGVGGGSEKADVERFADSGLDLMDIQNPALNEITAFYLEGARRAAWKGGSWREGFLQRSVDDQIEHVCELVHYAKEKGLKSRPNVNMLSYASPEYLEKYCRAVSQAGADYIAIFDGSGGMGPEAWRYVVSQVKRATSPACKIVIHAHNPFGLAVASSLAAVQAGADIVEASVDGLGPSTMQADLAEVVAALEILYGVKTGVRLDRMVRIARLVRDFTRFGVAWCKPVTGDYSFSWAGDGNLVEMAVDPLVHAPVVAEVFGGKKVEYVGRDSGNLVVSERLKASGVQIERDLIPRVVAKIKSEIDLRKRLLSDEEIREVALEVARGT